MKIFMAIFIALSTYSVAYASPTSATMDLKSQSLAKELALSAVRPVSKSLAGSDDNGSAPTIQTLAVSDDTIDLRVVLHFFGASTRRTIEPILRTSSASGRKMVSYF